jgi:glycosyltransferase involved in cell wall biosynthesis
MQQGPLLDLFVDLSGSTLGDAALSRLASHVVSPDGLGSIAGHATWLVPRGVIAPSHPALPLAWSYAPDADARHQFNEAVDRASRRGLGLLVVLDALAPEPDAVGRLLAGLDDDPFHGCAIPRIALADGSLRRLTELGDPHVLTLPRAVLDGAPETYLLPELVTTCFLLRADVLRLVGPAAGEYATLTGALWQYLVRARRMGYRSLVVNRAVVASAPEQAIDGAAACLRPVDRDVRTLTSQYPDVGRGQDELERHPCHVHETFRARVCSADPTLRHTLLLDGRGMPGHFNGTSEAVLGVCDGFRDLESGWRIMLLAGPEAIGFHGLRGRYPMWRVQEHPGPARAAAALRLSQPWHIRTLAELHEWAYVNAYSMLDTILLDGLYGSPQGLAGTWSFLSMYCDGVTYDSAFTRDRFRRRFPLSVSRPDLVHYYACHPAEYVDPSVRVPDDDSDAYLFVIGNDYDHKRVGPTLEMLSTAFPFQPFKVLGRNGHAMRNVTGVPSGLASPQEVERLYAQARLVVFPSVYEGFGFPILRGLSYGRTVIARRSLLLDEIAAQYRGPGRLVPFGDEHELTEIVGRLLHGLDVPAIPLGTAVPPDGEPVRWKDVARQLLAFVERLMTVPDSRWSARQDALAQIQAYLT